MTFEDAVLPRRLSLSIVFFQSRSPAAAFLHRWPFPYPRQGPRYLFCSRERVKVPANLVLSLFCQFEHGGFKAEVWPKVIGSERFDLKPSPDPFWFWGSTSRAIHSTLFLLRSANLGSFCWCGIFHFRGYFCAALRCLTHSISFSFFFYLPSSLPFSFSLHYISILFLGVLGPWGVQYASSLSIIGPVLKFFPLGTMANSVVLRTVGSVRG